MFRKTMGVAAVVLMAAVALAGCSTGAGGSPSPEAATESPPLSGALEVDAAWLDGGSMIALVTWGSSTCVPTAGEVAYEDGVLSVEMVDPLENTACTRDFVPRATAVALPEGIDSAEDLTVAVTSSEAEGDVVLAGVPGLVPADGLSDGGVPSAGWTGSAGTIALLTWGSSSCTPTVQDAAVTASNEITVTFVDPPADQVCTMDFSPRVTVVTVDGVEAGTGYELVLQGAEFAGSRVPVVGEGSAA